MLGVASTAHAQQRPTTLPADTTDHDSLRADTTRTLPDVPDAMPSPSTAADAPAGDDNLNNPVQLSAADSLIITFDDENGDTGTLHGEAEMQHEETVLQGPRIDMFFETNELRAVEEPTAQGTSRPVFQQGEGAESFSGSTLSYNLQTGRGRVVGGRRTMNEGFVEGSVTKMFEDSTVFLQDGQYSTCDCPPGETPSYSLRSDRMKLSEKWVYSGPIRLYIFNIPTPFWLPFGFLPNVEGRRSGPLPPQYGEDQLGLYLRDWGWYFAMNDYMDLQLRFGLWSQGSYEIKPHFRYARRYAYDGSLRLTYNRNRRGEREDPNFTQNRQGELQWNHDQTINPTSSFRSNLRLVTSSQYLRSRSDDYDDRVRQSISSGMRYSKRWPESNRNVNVRVDHRQNFADQSVRLTLPDLSFSQPQFKPFESDESTPGRDERWYERLTVDSYKMSLSNTFDFTPIDPEDLIEAGDSTATEIDWYEAFLSPSKYRRATGDDEPFEFKASHRTGLNMPFNLPRYRLNVSPNVSYTEDWYIRTVRKRLADSTETGDEPRVVEESVPGFFARREFNTGVSANTTFYGLFPIQAGAYRGLRHTVQPSLSFNYRPNFNSNFWGYTRSYVDAEGEEVRYDIIDGNTVRGSTMQRAMSFNLRNGFETKRVRVDSTGEEQSQTIRLLNLDLSSSYNFAADSLKLSDIQLTARTDLFEQFDIRFRSTFSPYQLGPEGRVIDRYVAEGPGLAVARLTRLSFGLGTSLQGGQSGTRSASGSPPTSASPGLSGPSGQGPQQADATPQLDPYANFSIPWDLNLNFDYSLNRSGTRSTQRARLNVTSSFALTPMWRVNVRSGYDIVERELVTTDISINRDLGCWVMSFNWSPVGSYQSYGFSLRVKSGPVQQLLNLRLPRSDRNIFLENLEQQAAGGLPPGGGF